jgi:lysophospholipase L1-like esterase
MAMDFWRSSTASVVLCLTCVVGRVDVARAHSPHVEGHTPVDGQCFVDDVDADQSTLFRRGVLRPETTRGFLQARRLRRTAQSLRAPGGALEDPCADLGADCAPAMAAAYAAFDGAAARGERAGVAIVGNSLIAADRIVNVIRRRLQEQLGDGGRGLLLPDRLGTIGPRDRTASSASGWTPATVADFEPRPEARGVPRGVGGAVFVSTGPATSRFDVHDERSATVFAWAGPRGSGLELRADGGRFHPVLAVPGESAQETPVLHRFLLPKGTRTIELRTLRSGAAVHGVALEGDGGGVVVDTLGVAAADARRFLSIDAALFSQQLDARRPDLVVLMLGGNETKRLAWGRESLAELRASLSELVRRVKPGADRSCLVVGPIDAVIGADDRNGFRAGPATANPFVERPELHKVNALHRQVAWLEGCAFFDLYAAMGGAGSLRRLFEANALHDDLVHPKELGLAVLGQLIADALVQGWATTPDLPRDHVTSERGSAFAVSTSLDEARVEVDQARPSKRL